jgi:hypothetical protein
MDPIKIARRQSRQDETGEKESTEKHKESLTKAQLNLTTKEMAVFFYCPTK